MSNSRCSHGGQGEGLLLAGNPAAVEPQFPGRLDGVGESGVVEELQRPRDFAAPAQGPVPLAAEEGHGLLRIEVHVAGLAAAEAEFPAGNAVPAEALGHHLGEQAAAALRVGPRTGKAALAAELGQFPAV